MNAHEIAEKVLELDRKLDCMADYNKPTYVRDITNFAPLLARALLEMEEALKETETRLKCLLRRGDFDEQSYPDVNNGKSDEEITKEWLKRVEQVLSGKEAPMDNP